MKYSKIIVLSILILSSLTLSAQDQPKFVSIDGETINIGNHIRGKEVVYEIKFKNDGIIDLKIDNVSATCGCSSALVSENVIKPGESGTIKFTFNGLAQGKVTKSVMVYTNDEIGIHTISLVINMVEPLTLNPTAIMTSGKKGEEVSQTVTLLNSFGKEITVTEITSNSPVVKFTNDKPVIQDGEMAVIDLKIKIYEDSPVNAALFIKTSEGEFNIPIFVDITK